MPNKNPDTNEPDSKCIEKPNPNPPQQCPKAFEDKLIELINDLRRKHGTPEVMKSSSITIHSQTWAQYLANRNGKIWLNQPKNRYNIDIVSIPVNI